MGCKCWFDPEKLGGKGSEYSAAVCENIDWTTTEVVERSNVFDIAERVDYMSAKYCFPYNRNYSRHSVPESAASYLSTTLPSPVALIWQMAQHGSIRT